MAGNTVAPNIWDALAVGLRACPNEMYIINSAPEDRRREVAMAYIKHKALCYGVKLTPTQVNAAMRKILFIRWREPVRHCEFYD